MTRMRIRTTYIFCPTRTDVIDIYTFEHVFPKGDLQLYDTIDNNNTTSGYENKTPRI